VSDLNCKFSYKTAADYMRVAKQKSRGLDFSSLDGMKKATRKERPAKPVKPKMITWIAAVSQAVGGQFPPGFARIQRLDRDEQATAIRRLAASGLSEYSIASATRLSVEMIRRVLARGAQ
jgi:hypothetical protein